VVDQNQRWEMFKELGTEEVAKRLGGEWSKDPTMKKSAERWLKRQDSSNALDVGETANTLSAIAIKTLRWGLVVTLVVAVISLLFSLAN